METTALTILIFSSALVYGRDLSEPFEDLPNRFLSNKFSCETLIIEPELKCGTHEKAIKTYQKLIEYPRDAVLVNRFLTEFSGTEFGIALRKMLNKESRPEFIDHLKTNWFTQDGSSNTLFERVMVETTINDNLDTSSWMGYNRIVLPLGKSDYVIQKNNVGVRKVTVTKSFTNYTMSFITRPGMSPLYEFACFIIAAEESLKNPERIHVMTGRKKGDKIKVEVSTVRDSITKISDITTIKMQFDEAGKVEKSASAIKPHFETKYECSD